MVERPATRPVTAGDELTVTIDSLADGPDALARVGGYVLFVSGGLPGERVRVRVVNAGRKYGRAEILGLEQRAAERVEARCAHFGDCGGCHLQHLDYGAQLRVKTERLAKELRFSLRRDDVPVQPMVGPPDPWQQRIKVVLHFVGEGDDLRAGFFRLRSHRLVEIEECPASDPRALDLARATVAALRPLRLSAFDPDTGQGLLRSIVVRLAAGTGEASVLLVVSREVEYLQKAVPAIHAAGATSTALNVNDGPLSLLLGRRTRGLHGPHRIAEEVAGVRYLVSPQAFFQTSAFGVGWIVDAVRRLLAPAAGDTLFDLYSGGGLLALALARQVREVVGIEDSRAAVKDAFASARINKIRNATFVAGRVERALGEVVRAGRTPTLVALDPPRAGCSEQVIAAVARLGPARIAYVSCSPETLARDLAAFVQRGYRLVSVEPLDMFPHAFHVEAVALLEQVR